MFRSGACTRRILCAISYGATEGTSMTPEEMTGAELIAAERQRQMEVEGWTPEHDDEHTLSELSRAAQAYALVASKQAINPESSTGMPMQWPWHEDWWKPKDPISNLVKAGALIAAEIDRLKRAKVLGKREA